MAVEAQKNSYLSKTAGAEGENNCTCGQQRENTLRTVTVMCERNGQPRRGGEGPSAGYLRAANAGSITACLLPRNSEHRAAGPVFAKPRGQPRSFPGAWARPQFDNQPIRIGLNAGLVLTKTVRFHGYTANLRAALRGTNLEDQAPAECERPAQ